MRFDVFISYSTKDAIAAKAACAALEAAKIRCWMAPRDIVPGARWGASIVQAINQCRVMVLIFSGNANESTQVQREVDQAFGKGKAVVPLRIEDVKPADDLAYYLDTVHWLDALTRPLENNLEKLVVTIAALVPTTEATPSRDEPTSADETNYDTQIAQAHDEARAAEERGLKEVEAAASTERARHEQEAASRAQVELERQRQVLEDDKRHAQERRQRKAEAQAPERTDGTRRKLGAEIQQHYRAEAKPPRLSSEKNQHELPGTWFRSIGAMLACAGALNFLLTTIFLVQAHFNRTPVTDAIFIVAGLLVFDIVTIAVGIGTVRSTRWSRIGSAISVLGSANGLLWFGLLFTGMNADAVHFIGWPYAVSSVFYLAGVIVYVRQLQGERENGR